ncbi:amidase domain-containing protein [Paramaledivibacter caminithermalis]|uniref:Putative amidase domain-containing protein n=1 Tax=Paramaledivibacter caminithermalis (strain DSM 15212 / CIP 107654 / DViRD3) TaxID=1121301 RepID=A0A1M6M781_PARC5|nr:amidase domain-containing protein [Paramaledivibacter caminithermalis]SHJ79298.1 Putative amidase domain-containing protein [Paramaledivibacter caminithermalis DSM 15212]
MIIVISRKRLFPFLIGILLLIIILLAYETYQFPVISTFITGNNEEAKFLINNFFEIRNKAIIKGDIDTIASLYDRDVKYGVWAYEHEKKKTQYLHKWSKKQGIKFYDIKSVIKFRSIKEREDGYRINFIASTEYKYYYKNEIEKKNMFRIGTYHSLDLKKVGNIWKIVREWYTDPFADSLHLDEIESAEITEYILSQKKSQFDNLNERRVKAVEYADRFCGAAADEEYGFNYNKKYINYNPLGGDCANFASQILYEGGKFRQTYTWKYDKGGSKAWVNAQAFKDYMIYSGRASKIAYGTYEQVYKASYKLLPGDFVAYQKKGKITHISVVTGADSKGYIYVHSHNTDRYRVPWDLGWNDKGIKFWLIKVHY